MRLMLRPLNLIIILIIVPYTIPFLILNLSNTLIPLLILSLMI